MPATPVVDFNGAALVVGQTVKLVGVITDINVFSNHYHEVTVTLSHPIAVPDVLVSPGGSNSRPAAGGVKTINVSGAMLVSGA